MIDPFRIVSEKKWK